MKKTWNSRPVARRPASAIINIRSRRGDPTTSTSGVITFGVGASGGENVWKQLTIPQADGIVDTWWESVFGATVDIPAGTPAPPHLIRFGVNIPHVHNPGTFNGDRPAFRLSDQVHLLSNTATIDFQLSFRNAGTGLIADGMHDYYENVYGYAKVVVLKHLSGRQQRANTAQMDSEGGYDNWSASDTATSSIVLDMNDTVEAGSPNNGQAFRRHFEFVDDSFREMYKLKPSRTLAFHDFFVASIQTVKLNYRKRRQTVTVRLPNATKQLFTDSSTPDAVNGNCTVMIVPSPCFGVNNKVGTEAPAHDQPFMAFRVRNQTTRWINVA